MEPVEITTPDDTMILVRTTPAAPRSSVRPAWSEVYEGAPEEESTVVTAEFADDGEGTALRVLIRSRGTANRDAVLASGFEAGLKSGYAVLEQLASERRTD